MVVTVLQSNTIYCFFLEHHKVPKERLGRISGFQRILDRDTSYNLEQIIAINLLGK